MKPEDQAEFLAEKYPLKEQKAGTLEGVGRRSQDNPPNFSCMYRSLTEADPEKVPSCSH